LQVATSLFIVHVMGKLVIGNAGSLSVSLVEKIRIAFNTCDTVFNWASNSLYLVNCLMSFVHFKVDSSLAIPSRGLSSYLLTAIPDFCNSIVLKWHCIFLVWVQQLSCQLALSELLALQVTWACVSYFYLIVFFYATLNWEIYSSRIVVAWMEMHCNGIFPKSDVKSLHVPLNHYGFIVGETIILVLILRLISFGSLIICVGFWFIWTCKLNSYRFSISSQWSKGTKRSDAHWSLLSPSRKARGL